MDSSVYTDMNKKYIYIALGLLILVAVFLVVKQEVIQPILDDRTVETVVGTQIVAKDYNFDFKYPSGVEGYALIEPPVATTSQSLKKAYLMFEYGQYLQYQNAQENEQTPPTVSVFVFALPEEVEDSTISRDEELLQWMVENPQYTSFNRKVGELGEKNVDGVFAYTYSTEGLYKQDFHIMSYLGNVYVFAAQYESDTDGNIEMYKNLINSITFN